jgi:hypothetical protein
MDPWAAASGLAGWSRVWKEKDGVLDFFHHCDKIPENTTYGRKDLSWFTVLVHRRFSLWFTVLVHRSFSLWSLGSVVSGLIHGEAEHGGRKTMLATQVISEKLVTQGYLFLLPWPVLIEISKVRSHRLTRIL